MTTKQKYSAYPVDYRAKEMATIARWILAGESGSVIGLGGAGKSNFLAFLCKRHEVLANYLAPAEKQLALVLVDLNNLPNDDLNTFFRVILRSFYEAQPQLSHLEPKLVEAVEQLYRKVEEKTDPFLSQSALRELLLHFQAYETRVVLVFDPFDRFCQTASPQMLDNLRGLRDGFKSTLSYLAGLRYDLPHLVKSINTTEVYEILDTHRCWLGTMSEDDAAWVISQRETATGQTFMPEMRKRLIELTGGYPALLRAASLWMAGMHLSGDVPDMADWDDLLFAESTIQNRLIDLRQGLTGVEEATLFALQTTLSLKSSKDRQESLRQIVDKYGNSLAELVNKGLCLGPDAGWQLSSPLIARFVLAMEGVSSGGVWRDSVTGRFYQGEAELGNLTKKERQLLGFFLENPQKICTIDHLIEGAWVEEVADGVSDETVQQTIRQVRKKIELNPAKPRYVVTVRGEGYYFDPDGSPSQS